MTSFFKRLLGAGPPAAIPATTAAIDAAPAEEPAVQLKSSTDAGESFVHRQPVLDRKQMIAGYQFSLPEEVELRLRGDFEFLPKIYDDAVLRDLTSAEEGALLGSRLSFVRISPDTPGNPRLKKLPKTNTVLMLAPVHRLPDAELLRPRLEALRQAGYAYGWLLRQDQVKLFPDLLALAAGADYAQVDASDLNGVDLKLWLKTLAELRPAGLPKLKLIAGGLDAFDEFTLYFKAGFEFFLGKFVTSRENWHPPKSNVNQLRVLKLLNLLRGDAEIAGIAGEFKHDPVLSFKLLRYINSPVMGLSSPVSGIDKALILLGREKFYRWLSLMLFDFKTTGFNERVLTEQALSRAHLLESLAGQGKLPEQADALFLLGLFSTLDLLMGQSMSDLLVQAKLPEPLRDALLGEPGTYRDALQLAVAAEGQSLKDIQQYSALCGLAPALVSRCATRALAWAHEVTTLETG